MDNNSPTFLKYITYRMLSNASAFYQPLDYFFHDRVSLDRIQYKNAIESDNKGLYIHIPFCVKVCSYCACNKQQLSKDDNIETYITYLIKELEIILNISGQKKLNFSSVLFGGGTPSILTASQLDRLFSGIFGKINREFAEQISFEVSPFTVTKEKVDIIKKHGIGRISMGVQAFDKDVLDKNNRPYIHEDKIFDIINYIKQQGIIIHADLMIGIMGQSLKSCLSDYQKLYHVGVDHITLNYYISHNFSQYSHNQELFNLQSRFRKLEEKLPNFQKKDTSLLQEKKLLSESSYSVVGIGSGSTTYLVDYIMYEKRNIEQYYSMLDKGDLPIQTGVFIEKRIKYIDIFLKTLRSGSLNIGEVNNLCNINILDFFKFELDFLSYHKILSYNEAIITLESDFEESFIYFTIFYRDLIENKKDIDFQGVFDKSWDINLISLIKES